MLYPGVEAMIVLGLAQKLHGVLVLADPVAEMTTKGFSGTGVETCPRRNRKQAADEELDARGQRQRGGNGLVECASAPFAGSSATANQIQNVVLYAHTASVCRLQQDASVSFVKFERKSEHVQAAS